MHKSPRQWGRLFGFGLAVVVSALALGTFACGNEEGGSSGSASESPSSGEMRSVEVTEAKVDEGRGLFATCAACHGEEGEGKLGQGPQLNSESFLAAASDDFLTRTISKGRAGTTMVAWEGTYSAQQIEALVSYIRSFNDVEPADLDERACEGDAAAGEELYASICAGCHGRTGAGYQETANGIGIGRRGFLDVVSDGYLRYIIEHGKSDTGMRGFGGGDPVAVANLTDEQIENVIAYLRANAW